MAENERLPIKQKVMYGAGDLTNALILTIIHVYFLKFLIDVVQLDAGLAGVALFVGRSADWINDPIVGYISDRVRTRWGRRRPFLLFGMAPLAIAFMFFFWIPPWDNQMALVAYYAGMYMVLDTAATIVYMPYYALTPEMTLDYDERTSLSTFRMMFNLIGSIIAWTTPLIIVRSFPDPRTGYFMMAVLFGTISVLPLLLVFFGTKEREAFQRQEQPTFKESLQAVRGNKPFLYGLGIFLLTWLVIDLLQPVMPFFIEYWLRMADQAELILGSIFISATVFLPLWLWIAKKWEKAWAYIVGMLFFVAVLVVLIFVQPEAPAWQVYTMTVLAGIGVAAAHVLPWAILPDAIEWDELQTGQRHEGAFYSVVTLTQKIASSIAIPMVAVLLDVTGYVPNAPQQTPQVLWTLRGLTAGVPMILLLGGVIIALNYPLNRERHASIRAQLNQERSAQATSR